MDSAGVWLELLRMVNHPSAVVVLYEEEQVVQKAVDEQEQYEMVKKEEYELVKKELCGQEAQVQMAEVVQVQRVSEVPYLEVQEVRLEVMASTAAAEVQVKQVHRCA